MMVWVSSDPEWVVGLGLESGTWRDHGDQGARIPPSLLPLLLLPPPGLSLPPASFGSVHTERPRLAEDKGGRGQACCGVAIGMGRERRGGGQCDRPQSGRRASRLWGISQAPRGRPDPGGVNSLLSLQLLVVPPVPLPSARPGLPSFPASPQPHSLSRRQAGLIASCTDSLGHCWLQVQVQPAGPGPRPLQPLGQGFSERASVLRSRVEGWQPRR